MKFKNLILIGILCLFLIGCNSPSQTVKIVDEIGATQEGLDLSVKANNDFTFDMYKELNSQTDNVFYSPWSISSAFSMVYEGAQGTTKEELETVMHFSDSQERKPSYAKLQNMINEPNDKYQLNTANAIWVQEDYKLLDSYLSTIDKYYAGKATNLNFAGNPSGSADTINSWVEDQTNNKIKDLIPASAINPLTRVILTNAIYFKGDWVKGFEKSDTKDEIFKSPLGDFETPMMKKTDKEANFNYFEDESVQVLEMDYKGDKVSMLVLLPKEEMMNELEQKLSASTLELYKTNMRNEKVNLYLPKFKFDTSYFLNQNLINMGMPSAFDDMSADFSGISGTNDLYISGVYHKAFVDVNEKGTEAAAATGIMLARSSAPSMPTIFRADHPFIFLIQEKETGTILFIGKVNKPEV